MKEKRNDVCWRRVRLNKAERMRRKKNQKANNETVDNKNMWSVTIFNAAPRGQASAHSSA